MGAGKTTLGRQLARRLDKRFVDADHELEARLGVAIPTIFEIEGEAGFRDREEAIIDELDAADGRRARDRRRRGACARRAARACKRERHGPVSARRARRRCGSGCATAGTGRCCRPTDPRKRLVELYQLRDPLYREVADHVIESDRDAVMRFVRWLDAEPCAER